MFDYNVLDVNFFGFISFEIAQFLESGVVSFAEFGEFLATTFLTTFLPLPSFSTLGIPMTQMLDRLL